MSTLLKRLFNVTTRPVISSQEVELELSQIVDTLNAPIPASMTIGAMYIDVDLGNITQPLAANNVVATARVADNAYDHAYLLIPPSLPVGSIITSVVLKGATASGTDNVVACLLNSSTSGSTDVMATTTITNGESTNTATSISYATISADSTYSASVNIKVAVGGAINTDAQFYYLKINYTIDNLGQR